MTRLFDLFLSIILIILFLPLLIPLIIILKFSGEGYVFYRQERIGYLGEPFYILKFATMLKNSPNMKGAYITTRNDDRVLPIGRILRKYKINELPQLYNVLIGDMSFVGPRPQVQSHLNLYPVTQRKQILSLRPGITGISSLFFRDEEEIISSSKHEPLKFYSEFIVPYKIKLELWYYSNICLKIYFIIIFLTFFSLFIKSNKFIFRFLTNLPQPANVLLK